MKMRMEGNRLVDRSIHWIQERQREDGGWLHRSTIPARKNYDKAESCIWTTAEVVNMLAARKSFRRTALARKACDFLLDRTLKPNTDRLFPSVEAWDHLAIGQGQDSMFSGGTLKVLEGAVDCGFDLGDTRIMKLYDWLLSIQMENGYFPRITGKMPIADGLVTARALNVIRKLRS